MDRVTAVVVSHNGADEIEECLNHLVQGGAGRLHVVVVDNASTDATRELARAFRPAVELVDLPHNRGYGFGANTGAARSDRDFIAVINQDARASPGWLEQSVKALEATPTAAFVTPKILIKQDPERINTCGNAIHISGITTCRGYNQPADSNTKPTFVMGMSGAALVGRLGDFRRLGGFDESFFMYHEDTDLSLRSALAGINCLYEPSAVVLHSFEPSFSADKLYLLERNRYITLLKVVRIRTLFLLGPVLVLAELAVWGYCVSRGRSAVASKFKAWLWLITHGREISSARRATQRLRAVDDRALLAAMTDVLDLSELDSSLVRFGAWPVNLFSRVWARFARAVAFW